MATNRAVKDYLIPVMLLAAIIAAAMAMLPAAVDYELKKQETIYHDKR